MHCEFKDDIDELCEIKPPSKNSVFSLHIKEDMDTSTILQVLVHTHCILLACL